MLEGLGIEGGSLHNLSMELWYRINTGCFLLLIFAPLYHVPVNYILVAAKFVLFAPYKGQPYHIQGKALDSERLPLLLPPSIQEYPGRSPLELLLLTAYVLAKPREKKHFPHPELCKRTFCDRKLFYICGAQYGNY